MDFVKANVLKEMFDVKGHFYKLSIGDELLNCRSSLKIISKDLRIDNRNRPEAVFIMMNPGSSKPADNNYLIPSFTLDEIYSPIWDKKYVPTRPDNAQYQIMRLMILNNWDYVKVINLSDLRNGNSNEFSNDFNDATMLNPSNPHCITHPDRRVELKEELRVKTNGVTIAAWGNVEVLRDSATYVLENVRNIYGIESDFPWYKHASPQKYTHKLEWLNGINTIINNR